MKRQLAAIVVVALIVISFAAGGAGAARALRANPTAVAVIDLPRVLDQLKEQAAVRADLTSRTTQLRDAQQQKNKELQTLQGDLDMLKVGTPAFQEKQAQLERATIDMQVWSEFEARKLRMEEQLQVENLLRKVNDAVGRIAQDNGIDVVLLKGQQMTAREGNQQAQLNLRYVAWNSDSVDITDQVVQRMNNEFSAGQ